MPQLLKASIKSKLSQNCINELLCHGILILNEHEQLELSEDCFTQSDINYVEISESIAQNNNIYVEVIEFLNQEAKTRYRSNVTATQRLIKARVKEGFTLDDFKAVIRSKCADWGSDPQMKKYIRPATLFAATKFEGYLNQAEPVEVSQQKEPPQGERVNEVIDYGVQMDW